MIDGIFNNRRIAVYWIRKCRVEIPENCPCVGIVRERGKFQKSDINPVFLKAFPDDRKIFGYFSLQIINRKTILWENHVARLCARIHEKMSNGNHKSVL